MEQIMEEYGVGVVFFLIGIAVVMGLAVLFHYY